MALSIWHRMFGINYGRDNGALQSMRSLATLFASICLGVRRMRDTGNRCWLILIPFVTPYFFVFAGT